MVIVTYWCNIQQQRLSESTHDTLEQAEAFVLRYKERFPILQLKVGY